jgi:hypothetical protein
VAGALLVAVPADAQDAPVGRAGSAAPATATTATGTAATSGTTRTASAAPTDPAAATLQARLEREVSAAAEAGITQSVAVIDATTGSVVAAVDADRRYNSESILKPLTAAAYLVDADGEPDEDLQDLLRALITVSDDSVQRALWTPDLVTDMAQRYGLTDTEPGPSSSASSWGSDRTTAADMATFLFAAAADSMVGPWLTSWMQRTEPTAADGYDQAFGLNAVVGDRGSKQGWSDPGWEPYNVHSIGWVGRYVTAVLTTSPTASARAMRTAATATADVVADQAATEPVAEPLCWLASPAAGAQTVVGSVLAAITDGATG